MARWINYRDEDDRQLEIGRPLIRADARRHQRRAAQPSRPDTPLPGRLVLVVRQPGDVIVRRCRSRGEALAEIRGLPERPGIRYEICGA